MRFFEISIELLSPTIVVSRVTRTGYLSPLKYIPGSTLRGAILAALFRANAIDGDFLEREAVMPSLISSPAYPLVNGRRSYPCHPFAYQCKVKKQGKDHEIKNYASYVLSSLEEGCRPKYETVCSKGHAALEPLYPEPCIPSNGRLETVDVTYHGAVCVSISKHRASSKRGMIFEYEAIAPRQKFWAKLALSDELCGKVEKGFELTIGRGVSRGFGRARITEVEEVDVKDEAARAEAAVEHGRVVLYALSHTLSIENATCKPYPSKIDLANVADRCDLLSQGIIRIECAYGRTGAYSAGWDMLKNIERPTLRPAANPGSILVAEVSGGKVGEGLAALAFAGTIEVAGPFALAGVNMLTPLRGHPMAGS